MRKIIFCESRANHKMNHMFVESVSNLECVFELSLVIMTQLKLILRANANYLQST